MKVASQVGREEGAGARQLVSPLEQTLDAAVESERHRWVRAARRRAELMRVTPHPVGVALAGGSALKAGPLGELRPAHVSASVPARHGTRAKPAPFVRRPRLEVSGWVQLCGVALGLLAILTAFKLPVSATLPPPARELGGLTPRAAPGPERADDVRASSGAVLAAEPQQVAPEPEPPNSMPPTSMLQPSQPREGASARPTLDSGPLRSAVAPASPALPQLPRLSAAPVAQRAPASAGQVLPAKRADVVTVDDLFGIGGDEPLPPEALEEPTPAAPPPPRARKPTRAAPAAPSALFYQTLPF
jgi:hypothetical protein